MVFGFALFAFGYALFYWGFHHFPGVQRYPLGTLLGLPQLFGGVNITAQSPSLGGGSGGTTSSSQSSPSSIGNDLYNQIINAQQKNQQGQTKGQEPIYETILHFFGL